MEFKISDGIDIGPMLEAYKQFHQSISIAKSDLEKAGVIQYFEFTFELAWKSLKRVLQTRGKSLNSPKTVFREAAAESLIDDPIPWFLFIEYRNETVHTYNKEVADRIFSKMNTFDMEMDKLISTLKKLK